MNARIKKLWIKALRSGKYKQGQSALRFEGKYCCLAVLCDLHRKEVGGRWWRGTYDGAAYLLPKSVRKWAGLRVDDPVLVGKQRASHLNDAGRDFKYIADRIEARL